METFLLLLFFEKSNLEVVETANTALQVAEFSAESRPDSQLSVTKISHDHCGADGGLSMKVEALEDDLLEQCVQMKRHE